MCLDLGDTRRYKTKNKCVYFLVGEMTPGIPELNQAVLGQESLSVIPKAGGERLGAQLGGLEKLLHRLDVRLCKPRCMQR